MNNFQRSRGRITDAQKGSLSFLLSAAAAHGVPKLGNVRVLGSGTRVVCFGTCRKNFVSFEIGTGGGVYRPEGSRYKDNTPIDRVFKNWAEEESKGRAPKTRRMRSSDGLPVVQLNAEVREDYVIALRSLHHKLEAKSVASLVEEAVGDLIQKHNGLTAEQNRHIVDTLNDLQQHLNRKIEELEKENARTD